MGGINDEVATETKFLAWNLSHPVFSFISPW